MHAWQISSDENNYRSAVVSLVPRSSGRKNVRRTFFNVVDNEIDILYCYFMFGFSVSRVDSIQIS